MSSGVGVQLLSPSFKCSQVSTTGNARSTSTSTTQPCMDFDSFTIASVQRKESQTHRRSSSISKRTDPILLMEQKELHEWNTQNLPIKSPLKGQPHLSQKEENTNTNDQFRGQSLSSSNQWRKSQQSQSRQRLNSSFSTQPKTSFSAPSTTSSLRSSATTAPLYGSSSRRPASSSTRVIKAGWLSGRKGRVIKRWRPLYCVLKADLMMYLYANENTVNGKLLRQLRVADVLTTTSMVHNGSTPQQFTSTSPGPVNEVIQQLFQFQLCGLNHEGKYVKEDLRGAQQSDYYSWVTTLEDLLHPTKKLDKGSTTDYPFEPYRAHSCHDMSDIDSDAKSETSAMTIEELQPDNTQMNQSASHTDITTDSAVSGTSNSGSEGVVPYRHSQPSTLSFASALGYYGAGLFGSYKSRPSKEPSTSLEPKVGNTFPTKQLPDFSPNTVEAKDIWNDNNENQDDLNHDTDLDFYRPRQSSFSQNIAMSGHWRIF